MKILITCPPMIQQIERYKEYLKKLKIEYFCPNVVQTLEEKELIGLLPKYDGWVIGDDNVTENILKAGKKGKFRCAVKWGVGTDNIDFYLFNKYQIPISNTPNMFGNEVANLAINYLICLARHSVEINNSIRNGIWKKITGSSLTNKKVALLGFGNIGESIGKRLVAMDMNVYASDPFFKNHKKYPSINFEPLGKCLDQADYLIISCALNKKTFHIINRKTIKMCKKGVRIINVARGPIIYEKDLIEMQKRGHVRSVALDVFEKEPIDKSSELFNFKENIFGSHNGSNTIEAVDRTSFKVIDIIYKFLSS